MKIIIGVLAAALLAAASPAMGDELVLKTGEVISGDILELKADIVRIRIQDKERTVDRQDVEAAFIGDATPFSTQGYPGLNPAVDVPEPPASEKNEE